MKNKKGNATVIAIIVVIVAITASVITWLVATKKQVSVQSSIVQSDSQALLPIINLNKTLEEELGKKFSHVAIEYKKNANADKKIIHELVHEISTDPQAYYDPQYEVSYLSPKYLIVSSCVGLTAPCFETLFDLEKLQEVNLQFPMNLGSYAFYENEKYIVFKGIGRMAKPGISIEMIDGKKVYCLISEEDVSDVVVKNGVMSFTEYALVEGKGEIITKKEVNIIDFCKNL
jgi:hypothetical protein